MNLPGSYECQCHDGFKLKGERLCVDIDECKDEAVCAETAGCVNTIGSFECACLTGFVGNGTAEDGCRAECQENEEFLE
jgi:hypothetical protein